MVPQRFPSRTELQSLTAKSCLKEHPFWTFLLSVRFPHFFTSIFQDRFPNKLNTLKYLSQSLFGMGGKNNNKKTNAIFKVYRIQVCDIYKYIDLNPHMYVLEARRRGLYTKMTVLVSGADLHGTSTSDSSILLLSFYTECYFYQLGKGKN